MFEWLKDFPKVIVTGPQRSGTRITAKMIAFDTGHTLIDEFDIEMDSLYEFWWRYDTRLNFVAQCPSLCRYAHIFGENDDTAIVLVRRNIADIIASQERVKWINEKLELARYDRTDGIIAEVKYQFWDEHQKPRIKHAFEVEYEQLAAHALWLPQEQRNWTWAFPTFGHETDIYRNPDVLLSRNPETVFVKKDGANDGSLYKVKGRNKQLNETAKLVWELCDGSRGFAEIIEVLKSQYDGVSEHTLEEDVSQFLNQMIRLDYIRVTLQ
jgi:hypothetical protein